MSSTNINKLIKTFSLILLQDLLLKQNMSFMRATGKIKFNIKIYILYFSNFVLCFKINLIIYINNK